MKEGKWYEKTYRRFLLDFHIDDWNEAFLSRFDPEHYAECVALANGTAATVFANTHTGLCNYPTRVGRMHARFEGRDVLGEMVSALHRRGISAIVYYCTIYVGWYWNQHPEARVVDAEGKSQKLGINCTGTPRRFGLCCPNNPGYRQFVVDQLAEICDGYDFEGVWPDMTMWPTVCYCSSCQERYRSEAGQELPRVINWESPEWVRFQRTRECWLLDFCQLVTSTIKGHKPQATVAHQSQTYCWDWLFASSVELIGTTDWMSADLYGERYGLSYSGKLFYGLSPHEPFERINCWNVPNIHEHIITHSEDFLRANTFSTFMNGGALPKPEVWWPVGHGAQPLYTVSASLSVGDDVVGSDARRVGFRHVRVNQDPHPAGGSYFLFEINGKPIFAKGGNFVPADMIAARLDRTRYATLVDRAVEANFNMLRMWGGGRYESDEFYDICDERGMLVWQEFIFACAKYPTTDEQFLADVKREATYQVRRLAHHPSLVAWCGNNEMEEGAYHWGYEKGVAYSDYALFHMVLPVVLKQEDGTHYYQPSSPYSPNHEDPRRDDMGDQHPWHIAGGMADFRNYRGLSCRFPNEGGQLGPNSLPTVLACLPPDQRFLHSFAWDVHNQGATGDVYGPEAMVERWLGIPVRSLTVEDYVYYGGIVHGQGLVEYIRNFRRRMFDTAAAIFWMYNDCWPVVRSFTIVDYYLRRTPAFYPVRMAFQPLSVALAHEAGTVLVFGVNEGPEWKGDLDCGLFALAGGYPYRIGRAVALPANASTLVAEFPDSEWFRLGERTHGAFARLTRDGRLAAQDCLFLPYYKDMVWPRTSVRVTRKGDKAIFESDVFAWRVCLDLDGEKALPDNFFDVLPGIPRVLDWPGALGEPVVLRVGNLVQ